MLLRLLIAGTYIITVVPIILVNPELYGAGAADGVPLCAKVPAIADYRFKKVLK
jgi:hypothetical protein